MKWLKMTEIPDDRKFALGKVAQHLASETSKYTEQLKKKPIFSDVDWNSVSALQMDLTAEFDGNVEDRERAAWMHVLGMERASYLEQYEAGELEPSAFFVLETFMAKMLGMALTTSTDKLGKLYDDEFHDMMKSLTKRKSKDSVKVAFSVGLAYDHAMHSVQHITHDADDYKTVAREHEDNIENMIKLMDTAFSSDPALVKECKTRHVIQCVL